MLDARSVYRKVTRKIYDFSPEQMKNLDSIVWLYCGQHDRFHPLVKHYLSRVCEQGASTPAAAITSGVPRIDFGILKPFGVLLASLDVQARIAELLSTYDDLIENNRRRTTLLASDERIRRCALTQERCYPSGTPMTMGVCS